MNLATLPYWLSPGWLLFYLAIGACVFIAGYSISRQRDRARREAARRAAERTWPESRGVITACPMGPNGPEVTVSVPCGPQRGVYRVQFSTVPATGCKIDQEVVCRIGRYPDDRIENPLRCVITQVL